MRHISGTQKHRLITPRYNFNIKQVQTKLRNFLCLTHHQAAGHEKTDD
jgi:hypothetical protein